MKCKETVRAFWNVVLQSLSMMTGVASVIALTNAENYIIESEKLMYRDYQPEALYGLFIFDVAGICFLLVSPSLVALIGPRSTMAAGMISRVMYIAVFFFPVNWLFYGGHVFGGMSMAFIFAAEGVYRIQNSTKETITRNSTMFCLLLQSSYFIGNLCVFLTIRKETLDIESIRLFLIICTALACISLLFISMMSRAVYADVRRKGPQEIFLELFILFIQRDMALMYFSMLYCGMTQSVVVGIYSSSLAFSGEFSMNQTKLVALSGMLIGIGEIVCGVAFILLERRKKKYDHRYFMLLGFILNTAIHVVTLLTLPNASTKHVTKEPPILKSNLTLALICSVFFGLGDNCLVTQIYGFVGRRFPDKNGPGCTILTLTRSVGLAIGFLCARVGYYLLLGVTLLFGVVGTVTFFIVEIKSSRSDAEENLGRVHKIKSNRANSIYVLSIIF